MTTGYNEILVYICNSNIIIHHHYNVTGCEEPSLIRSSNPDPLTYRANDQTTELFITTNIHKIAPEGPRAGMLRA